MVVAEMVMMLRPDPPMVINLINFFMPYLLF